MGIGRGRMYTVVGNGERMVLLDDRGWSSGAATIAHEGLRVIEDTAREVVGPDGPGPDETNEQMEAWYWGLDGAQASRCRGWRKRCRAQDAAS